MRISKKNAGIIRTAIALAQDHMNFLSALVGEGKPYVDPITLEDSSVQHFLTHNSLAYVTYIRTVNSGTRKMINATKAVRIRDGFHD